MTAIRLSDYPADAEPGALVGRLALDLETGEEGRIVRVAYSPSRNELLAVMIDFGDCDEDGDDVWIAAHPDDVELVMDS